MSLYEFTVKNAKGEDISLSQYKGKVLLIVNTASKCGFTPQYEELESLHEKYAPQGLQILGFPCNQFGGQEPGSNDEIQEFCSLSYGVKFPIFQKIEVNGSDTHPVYTYLKEQAPGLLGSTAIKWNFTKFLISKDGNNIERFAPTTSPMSMEEEIQQLLEQ